MKKQIEIYRGMNGEVVLDVDMERETIWASHEQMAELFGVDRTSVVRHINNIYREGELDRKRTCVKNAHVRMEGRREVKRIIDTFSLDAIISVGYRVNSRRATDFRVWATTVLRKYIVDGVAVNKGRISELEVDKLRGVEGTLRLVRRLIEREELSAGEAGGVLEVITRYADSFRLLREYDEGRIVFTRRGKVAKKVLTVEMALRAVDELRGVVGGGELFGKVRDGSFEGAIGAIYQSYAGRELYGSVEEKAANLLYLVVKDHPFYDGNKRIGAMLFVVFLTMNDFHLDEGGECKISDRALTAVTLLIAESAAGEKELMVALLAKLLS